MGLAGPTSLIMRALVPVTLPWRLCVRVLQIVGAILIAAGLFMIIKPPSYSREESVFKLGELEAKVQQQHKVPGWVGGVALGAGLVMVVVGFRRK